MPAPDQPQSASTRPLLFLVGLLLAVCLLAGFMGMRSVARIKSMGNTPIKLSAAEERKNREKVVLDMIRMGAEDWSLACAYSLGLDRRPRDEMYRACTVKWDIGEPAHPHRRLPKAD